MVLVVTGTGSDCKLVNNGDHSVDAVMVTDRLWQKLSSTQGTYVTSI